MQILWHFFDSKVQLSTKCRVKVKRKLNRNRTIMLFRIFFSGLGGYPSMRRLLLPNAEGRSAPRKYSRTIVQTTSFWAKNTSYTSIDDIFLLKTLQI